MSYCVNPQCQQPLNPNGDIFCRNCGCELLLKKRYRALKMIGSGGFGRTFLAVDEDIPSQPQCVIKQLYFQSQEPSIAKKAVELFHQEAVRLDELGQHPQIPALLAHFAQNQQLYLVQELIEGQTLEQELQQQKTFNEAQIWQLLEDLLPVLKFVHKHLVIHRDIKPANIIRRTSYIYPQGNKQATILQGNIKKGSPLQSSLVLIDFGVAKSIAGTGLLHTGTHVGSPEYIAPEQTRGKALPASDLYSLGVTCIHLLTGVSPFNLFDINNDRWVWRNYLPKGTQVSDRLSRILDKLLQDAVKDRYQSVDEVLQALNQVKVAAPKLSPPSLQSTLPKLLTTFWQQHIQHTFKPNANPLISETGVDYTKLQHLLATNQWQQADEETWTVMCRALGKLPGSYLKSGDIDRLPCEDLGTIDKLWVRYSGGRFGFSVQKQIYEDVDGEYPSLCDRLGWSTHNPYPPDSALNFSLQAPRGHLPSRRWVGGYEWWHHAKHVAARLEGCGFLDW